MLFHVSYTFKGTDEESAIRGLQLFANWTPPAGFEFKSHYAYADGSGGFNVVEAETAVALHKACSVFAPHLDFIITPIVEIEEGVAGSQEAIAYWGAVG